MGIFNRVKDIVTANINALLDKAEDPSKMLRLMIQEMEDTIIDLKSSCAAQLADRKTAERELNSAIEKIAQWENRAELALEKKREDLAKEALVEKRTWNEKKVFLEKHLDSLSKSVELSREDIVTLEKKLLGVKNRYKELTLRSKKVENDKRVNVYDSESRFAEMERTVDKMESEYDVNTSLENEFSKLEGDSSIDSELENLKKKIRKGE